MMLVILGGPKQNSKFKTKNRLTGLLKQHKESLLSIDCTKNDQSVERNDLKKETYQVENPLLLLF